MTSLPVQPVLVVEEGGRWGVRHSVGSLPVRVRWREVGSGNWRRAVGHFVKPLPPLLLDPARGDG